MPAQGPAIATEVVYNTGHGARALLAIISACLAYKAAWAAGLARARFAVGAQATAALLASLS